jgi:raffinose/stachyose/melibiose transport system permease protein
MTKLMRKKNNFLIAMLFILPALLVYLFYFIMPIPTSIYYSFFKWNGIEKPHYKLTPKTFETLKEKENIPDDILLALDPLLNERYENKDLFLKAVEEKIGKDQLDKYSEKILSRSFVEGMKFLKFENWITLFKDLVFWKSLLNNISLVIVSIIVQIPLGIILGVFVSSKFKGVKFLKLVYFIPMLLSAVAIGLTWNFIYDPTFGLLNAFLRLIGLGSLAKGWLGEPNLALWAVMGAICWQFIPYYMILFAAAISGIPLELYEAAYIDGASKVQGFFKITLPLLKNTIRLACVLSLTGSLRYFDLLYVMTGGGPNHASELMATYMFKQAFVNFNVGYGSAIASFMFMFSFILAVFILSRKREQIGIE